MGRFDVKTVEIRAEWWDEDEYVVVKERRWADDQKVAAEVMGKLPVGKSKAEIKALLNSKTLDLEENQVQLMIKSIETWTLKGPDGEIAPISEEFIRMLSKEDGDFIMEAVAELNPIRDDEFPPDSGDALSDGNGEAAD